jgi:hypothetical protein
MLGQGRTVQLDAAGAPQATNGVASALLVRIEHRLRFRIEQRTVDERQTAA